MDFTKFEEQVFLTTVLIENLTDEEFGTGFLMSKKIGDGKNKILLFSNKHVFWGAKDMNNQNTSKEIRITLHKKNIDGSYTPGAVQAFEFNLKRESDGYYDHPNPEVDVACLNVSIMLQQNISLNIWTIDYSPFSNFKRDNLYAGQKIIFLGYPTGFYDKKNFLPILRAGYIASIPSIDFNKKPHILVDAQVFPGSSGSPVFIQINSDYQLLGIISDGVFKHIDFTHITTTADKKTISLPREWIGLGLLHTNEMIKDVYNLVS